MMSAWPERFILAGHVLVVHWNGNRFPKRRGETMLVQGCEICQMLADGSGELIFQTDQWRVTLAPDQAYLGRAYVTLLEHCSSLSELTRLQIEDWQNIVIRYERLVWAVFGAAVFNWSCLMNNAFQADDPKPHVHWHVRPRYAEAPSVNGVEFPDPQFGHHYDRQYVRLVSPRMLASIGERLRSQLLSGMKAGRNAPPPIAEGVKLFGSRG